ncbi:MAG TPA: tetratricopeptide repeat protein [Chitinophagaceae bacterium]|nr:tetratricopeptide repeat protein [Chitinophagaceae bacterium]
MKYIFIIAVVYDGITGCSHALLPSSTPITNTEIKNDRDATILAGHCSLSILQTNPYKEWFDKSYNNYPVDTATVQLLQPLLQNKTIEVFLGSWCGDSKREVPRLIKILQAASFDTSRLHLIFVDNSLKKYKQSPQHEEAGKTIHHVPTIIVYSNNKESGRVIESPVVSLEKDILAITQHAKYTPNYADVAWWINNIKQRKTPLDSTTLATIVTRVKPLCSSMRDFNAYGYVLLAQNNYAEALNVFKLNTFIFPAVAGTYDSLGEAYLTAGNKEEARRNYQKVLELKPGDENAEKMLEQLK